jgi:coenzyme PQQ biosynthesis protein PqqD
MNRVVLIPLNRPKINRLYKLRGKQLLYPEGIVHLNDTAVKLLSLCDGTRKIIEIKDAIFDEYGFDVKISQDLNDSFLEFYNNKWIN